MINTKLKKSLSSAHLRVIHTGLKNNKKQKNIPWPEISMIVKGAHYLLNQMILTANSRPDILKGDPKVGGHSSASSSCLHILGALHLIVRKGFDFIANKPHASPTDHAYHFLLNLLLDQEGQPLPPEESAQAMEGLRAFPSEKNPYVFQSYHSPYDPDHQNFLPSGTVGIPPVVVSYLALAYQFAKDQGWAVPSAHFWSLIGDSEFREGSLFEAIPDIAERQLGAVTWIIDYNRQSLDGHRSTHPCLQTDDKRIEKTFLANGWEVIQVRHGQKRLKLFQEEDGQLFQDFFENKISDIDLQILLQLSDSSLIKKFILKKSPQLKKFLKNLSSADLHEAIHDLGGHDIQIMVRALEDSKQNKEKPCAVIAHTLKGWGLKMAGQPDNHSALTSKEELLQLKKQIQFEQNDLQFPKFSSDSHEGVFLEKRGRQLLKEMRQQTQIKEKNQSSVKQDFPKELGISLQLMSYPHTQWMLGQWVSKLSRIAQSDFKDLTEKEKPFHQPAKTWVGLSPDVGTSTNLSFSMDNKVYNQTEWKDTESKWNIFHKKSPQLGPGHSRRHRFLRFEIAESASLSCLAAFGKMKEIIGAPLFPLMSVYDFFIKRALDQYFYALYWKSSFILAGTPSGITLSPEGAQHGWKSDFQIPGQVCWEPYFCMEVDWILTDALYRHITDDNKNRTGVLIRAVTRGADQKNFLKHLKGQARFKKQNHQALLNVKDGSSDSSPCIPDDNILSIVREEVLKGAYPLIHFKGYKDYQPQENVVHIFAMGAIVTEACLAVKELLKKGIYANVIAVTSPDLLLGGLAHQNQYHHLKSGLGLDDAPVVSAHDGEPGLLDNIGSILGKKQSALAVRKHSLCGTPKDVNAYHGLDEKSIVQAVLKVMNP